MKGTNCGVNMDVATRGKSGGIKINPTITLRAYVDEKYHGLPDSERAIILHAGIQHIMKEGNKA